MSEYMKDAIAVLVHEIVDHDDTPCGGLPGCETCRMIVRLKEGDLNSISMYPEGTKITLELRELSWETLVQVSVS